MKIKELIQIRDKKQKEFEDIQKLEKLIKNNNDLCIKLEELSQCTTPIDILITSIRMSYYSEVHELDERLNKIFEGEI